MTIKATDPIVTDVRLVVEENLEDRLESLAAAIQDGTEVPVPRPGLRPDGDYFEWDARLSVISERPACAVVVRSHSPAPGVNASTMHQTTALTVIIWSEATGAEHALLSRRLRRYEAALIDLFTYRKNQLQTLENTAGSAVGVRWTGSTFRDDGGTIKSVEVNFEVRSHEQKAAT